MGEIMNSPKGVKSGVPESDHFLFHMWYPSRFTPNNWNPVMCHSWNKPFSICNTDGSNL